jgi:hypothetical protein
LSTTSVILTVIVAVVVLAFLGLVAAFISRERQRRALEDQFGPEYAHTVDVTGDKKQAEANLKDRVERRKSVSVLPLSPVQRDRYQQEWRQVQAAFVDAPASALGQADSLVSDVMIARGYPVRDFEEQADLVSVDHPLVVEHYRRAHGIYIASRSREVSTDEMRESFVSFRSLFSELVADGRNDAGTMTSGTAPTPATS